MNCKQTGLRVAAIGLIFLAGVSPISAADQDNPKNKQKNPPPVKQRTPGTQPGGNGTQPGGYGTQPGGTGTRPGYGAQPPGPGTRPGGTSNGGSVTQPGKTATPDNGPGSNPGKTGTPNKGLVNPTPAVPVKSPPVPLATKIDANGGYTKVAPSGAVRIKVEKKPDGEHLQQVAPTGRIEKEVVTTRDKRIQATSYDLGHREKKIEITHPDGAKEATNVHYDRTGQVRARETIKTDASGTPVSRTVVVKNNLVINNNTTIINNNTTIVREYRPCRYGYVYSPVVLAPPLFLGWYDPYWYAPPVVVGGPFVAIRTHSFSFSWGWSAEPWYAYHRAYWEPFPVYYAPSYWVTDWMVAGYLADRYAVAASIEQTRQEAELAREEAEKARLAAQQARDQAEIAEARAAQATAEARAERAEARIAKAQAEEARRKELAAAGKAPPNATPIDKESKEALKDQIEKSIAERKALAEQSANGAKPALPDVSKALADPKHIYPVSKTISVTRADDGKNAGTLTAGDLLKLEPGQENALKDASENTPINMRVVTSKGEDDSVPAGTVIAVPLKELQEFDNEFRAKLDQGLQEADKNKDQFKQMAQSAPK